MTSIFKAGYGEVGEFLGRLDRAGVNLERLRQVNKDGSLAVCMAHALIVAVTNAKKGIETNPFALPVETLIERLMQANKGQSWGIKKDTFTRLRKTAPALPEGRLAFLSFRIRFGEGQEGVERTANAHIAEILRVHGERNVWRSECLCTDKEHLRLLAGNETHKPVVEWRVIDLDTYRKRHSVTAARGRKSIADEGLVLAWLYPEYVRTIDHMENPAFFLAGYGLNVPEEHTGPWCHVPIVHRGIRAAKVGLGYCQESHSNSGDSVPSLRE